MSWSKQERADIKSRAFTLMLKVQHELLKNIIIHSDNDKRLRGDHSRGGYTIRELSEDNATVVIERALMAEQRRVLRPGRLGRK